MAFRAQDALPPTEDSGSPLDVGDLGAELQAWREALCVAPTSEARELHLLAMDLAAKIPEPMASSTSPSFATSRRRRVRSLMVPIAASFCAVVLSGGLASAGALPGPAQTQAARLAGTIGLHIPDGSGALERSPSGTPRGRISTTPAPGATATTVPRPGETAPGAAPTPPSPGGPAPTSATPAGGAGAGRDSPVDDGGPAQPGRSSGTPDPTTPAPGRGGSSPGKSGDTPGRTDGPSSPRGSGDAPGHDGD